MSASRESQRDREFMRDLVNVLFYGNPIYEGLSKKQARPKVLEHLPKIATLDGELLTGDDDDGGEEAAE
eukprot:g20854.t1